MLLIQLELWSIGGVVKQVTMSIQNKVCVAMIGLYSCKNIHKMIKTFMYDKNYPSTRFNKVQTSSNQFSKIYEVLNLNLNLIAMS